MGVAAVTGSRAEAGIERHPFHRAHRHLGDLIDPPQEVRKEQAGYIAPMTSQVDLHRRSRFIGSPTTTSASSLPA
ncbi:MAG: hypothetical protein JWM34_1625 [Ilumatobacteraceae bacterium]|nr:hypothetical protein [Ilumatobacteraceae bacterium]